VKFVNLTLKLLPKIFIFLVKSESFIWRFATFISHVIIVSDIYVMIFY